jgi:REP element-mobilizing transposase RayT
MSQRKNKQLNFFGRNELAYGGVLLNTRKGRSQGRPLSVKQSLHLTLRSTSAVGVRSFLTKKNSQLVQVTLKRFAIRYGIKILSLANVGNHIHLHLKLSQRRTYAPFIRAVTSAIAMGVSGTSRWRTLKAAGLKKFWDYRPFTRIVVGLRSRLSFDDYIKVNQLEGLGYSRIQSQTHVWMAAGRWRDPVA